MSDAPQQPPHRRRIEVENIGPVAVVRFVDKKLLDEQNIQMVGDDLFRLVDELGCRRLVLDFETVEFISSAALGKWITMHQKMQRVRGKVVFCRFRKDIVEHLRIIKLDRLFCLAPTLERALAEVEAEAHATARCAAPGCAGSFRLPIADEGGRAARCPECQCMFRLAPVPLLGEVPAERLELETYEGESVRATHARRWWEVAVAGRLDLFAAEALERLWLTLPEPRRVLLALTATTELTTGGAEVLVRLLATASALAVLFAEHRRFESEGPVGFRTSDRKEAERHLSAEESRAASLFVPVALLP